MALYYPGKEYDCKIYYGVPYTDAIVHADDKRCEYCKLYDIHRCHSRCDECNIDFDKIRQEFPDDEIIISDVFSDDL